MLNKNPKLCVYKNGLKVGDLVNYKYHVFGKKFTSGYELSSIVLKKTHLFNNDTRWGIRGFYEYEMLIVNPSKSRNSIITVKTQNMTLKKVNSTKQKDKYENSYYR